MTMPSIPVSWGELLDKISILEIKTHRIRDAQAAANAERELALLRAVAGAPSGVAELLDAQRAVNTRLWRIEDLIRQHEREADFGARFVALARDVYHENDERGRIKRALNQALGSVLVEEKQYSEY
jgi:Family of unknown function (DUF6165)